MTRRLVMGAYISPHGAGERPRKDRLGELLALAVGLLDFHRYLPKFCANGQKAGVIGRVVVVEQGRQ